MRKTSRGLRREGDLVECELSRADGYDEVVDKISDFLHLEDTPSHLYRPHGGILIPNQDLLSGLLVKWSLGSYMQVA